MNRMIRAIIVSLGVLSATVTSFAGGRAFTPNPQQNLPLYIIDYITPPVAQHVYLDEVVSAFNAFAAWQVSIGAPASVRVYTMPARASATYSVSSSQAFWTGTFTTLPVGNEMARPNPVVNCTIAPCMPPAWLSTWSNWMQYNGSSTYQDTAWNTVGSSLYANTVQLSTASPDLCRVEETRLNEVFDTPTVPGGPVRHVSGRKIFVNPDRMATATAAQKFSELNRCFLFASNVPVLLAAWSTVSLRHATEPHIVTSIPAVDQTAYLAVHSGGALQAYGYPMPAKYSPVY